MQSIAWHEIDEDEGGFISRSWADLVRERVGFFGSKGVGVRVAFDRIYLGNDGYLSMMAGIHSSVSDSIPL